MLTTSLFLSAFFCLALSQENTTTVFNDFDLNKDGIIVAGEIEKYCLTVDGNGDGSLTLSEFTGGQQPDEVSEFDRMRFNYFDALDSARPTPDGLLSCSSGSLAFFKMMDANGNQQLTPSELSIGLQKLDERQRLRVEFKAIDTDDNMVVSVTEIINFCLTFDKNGDGAMDYSEFQASNNNASAAATPQDAAMAQKQFDFFDNLDGTQDKRVTCKTAGLADFALLDADQNDMIEYEEFITQVGVIRERIAAMGMADVGK